MANNNDIHPTENIGKNNETEDKQIQQVADTIENNSDNNVNVNDNDDEFGDFGSFNDGAGTDHQSMANNNDIHPTENIGKSQETDQFGDFNNFNEAPTSEQPDSISKNIDNNINATEIVNEDDDFGDFGDFNTVSTKDAAKTSTSVLQSVNTNDDFGDFNESTDSTKEHVTQHNAKSALSADPTIESSRKTNQNDPGTLMDDADDFGDFGGFEDPTSTNKVEEKSLKDAFVEKAESVFHSVFQRYKDTTNPNESESHQPFAHVSVSEALVSRLSFFSFFW